jgi:hypothetical protein
MTWMLGKPSHYGKFLMLEPGKDPEAVWVKPECVFGLVRKTVARDSDLGPKGIVFPDGCLFYGPLAPFSGTAGA